MRSNRYSNTRGARPRSSRAASPPPPLLLLLPLLLLALPPLPPGPAMRPVIV
jgi:hypothetical protein